MKPHINHPSEYDATLSVFDTARTSLRLMVVNVADKITLDEHKHGMSTSEAVTIVGGAVISLAAYSFLDESIEMVSAVIRSIPTFAQPPQFDLNVSRYFIDLRG